jgi:ferrochelatase
VFLQDWAKQKVKSVQVLSPAFSADCLETFEELAIKIKNCFNMRVAEAMLIFLL